CLSDHLVLASFPTRRSSDLRSACGAVAGRPVLAHQLEGLVAERIDPGADGEPVGEVNVQAFDPRGHAARGDLVAERLDGVTLGQDRKSTRLNSSHVKISYAV